MRIVTIIIVSMTQSLRELHWTVHPSIHSQLCKASVAATRGRNKRNKIQVKHLTLTEPPALPTAVSDKVKKMLIVMGVLQCSGREKGGAVGEPSSCNPNHLCSSRSKKGLTTFQSGNNAHGAVLIPPLP